MIGWTYKQEDLNRLCPKGSPITGGNDKRRFASVHAMDLHDLLEKK